MRLINEHVSLPKIFPFGQLKDVNTLYLHLQYLMLSYTGIQGLPLNYAMDLCRPGSLIKGSVSTLMS